MLLKIANNLFYFIYFFAIDKGPIDRVFKTLVRYFRDKHFVSMTSKCNDDRHVRSGRNTDNAILYSD